MPTPEPKLEDGSGTAERTTLSCQDELHGGEQPGQTSKHSGLPKARMRQRIRVKNSRGIQESNGQMHWAQVRFEGNGTKPPQLTGYAGRVQPRCGWVGSKEAAIGAPSAQRDHISHLRQA